MLARNAAMKTIRMEYERYLEENTPRWQQQFQEKRQAAQKKKMENYLRSYKTEEEDVLHSALDGSLLSQGLPTGTQKKVAPHSFSMHELSDHNPDVSSQHPLVQSSWLTQTQTPIGRFPMRAPAMPQSSPFLPAANFPHLHPYMPPHPAFMPGPHHPQPRQDWAAPLPSHPWPWGSGIPPESWDQFYNEEPPLEPRVSQTGREEYEPSRALSSKRERGGRRDSSGLSQELDVKPVRLPSGHTESSESGRDSSLTCRERSKKKEKRERTQHSSSDRERHGSKESSRTSSEIIIASVAVAKSSERETSSEAGSTKSSRKPKRGGGLLVESPISESGANQQSKVKEDDSEGRNPESRSDSESPGEKEKVRDQSHADEPETCGVEEEPGSESTRAENGVKDERGKQESSSCEQSSPEEEEEGEGPRNQRDEDEKDNSHRNEKDSDVEDKEKEVSDGKNTTEEEEGETAEEDEEDEEQSKSSKNEESEKTKQISESSQDEEESQSIEDNKGSNEEEDGEDEKEKDHKDQKEDRDSDDSIISPQEKRSRQVQTITEEAEDDDNHKEEDEAGSSPDCSDEVSDGEEIENLLAPHRQPIETEEKEETPEKRLRGSNMDIFQVTSQQSDSDEFDHFYD
ncbi:uncharacterized protein ACNS7B_012593 isoform 1-T2 [Menidia menidia]